MTTNVAASVHQRLLNHARATDRPFNEVLQRFALERFLYRLGRSPHASGFVLKGALMLMAWQIPAPRPTRDIDLLGRMENTVAQVVSAVEAICKEPVRDDGLRFEREGITGERISETANYSGVRLRFAAYLGQARIPMRIDSGSATHWCLAHPWSSCLLSSIFPHPKSRATAGRVPLRRSIRSWCSLARLRAG